MVSSVTDSHGMLVKHGETVWDVVFDQESLDPFSLPGLHSTGGNHCRHTGVDFCTLAQALLQQLLRQSKTKHRFLKRCNTQKEHTGISMQIKPLNNSVDIQQSVIRFCWKTLIVGDQESQRRDIFRNWRPSRSDGSESFWLTTSFSFMKQHAV